MRIITLSARLIVHFTNLVVFVYSGVGTLKVGFAGLTLVITGFRESKRPTEIAFRQWIPTGLRFERKSSTFFFRHCGHGQSWVSGSRWYPLGCFSIAFHPPYVFTIFAHP